jgi:hypothetical protein
VHWFVEREHRRDSERNVIGRIEGDRSFQTALRLTMELRASIQAVNRDTQQAGVAWSSIGASIGALVAGDHAKGLNERGGERRQRSGNLLRILGENNALGPYQAIGPEAPEREEQCGLRAAAKIADELIARVGGDWGRFR